MNTRYQGSVIISSILLLFVVSALVTLGLWQLSRMHEKQGIIDDIAKKNSERAKPLVDVIDSKQVAPNRVVAVSGKINKRWIWLIDNKQVDGQIGYNVVVPVSTAAGKVLVDYGWVAAGRNRSLWPKPEVLDSLNAVKGVVTFPSENPFVNTIEFESQTSPHGEIFRIQGVDIDQQQIQSGLSLLPFVVTLTQPNNDFVRRWQPIVMPPQKHFAYAIQWFGLAIAALIIGGIVIKKSRIQYDKD